MKKAAFFILLFFSAVYSFSSEPVYDAWENYVRTKNLNEFKSNIENYTNSKYFMFLLMEKQENEYTKNILKINSLLKEEYTELSPEKTELIHELIMASQNLTYKNMKKTERLYQILIASTSFLSIVLMSFLVHYIYYKKRISEQKLEEEKKHIAAQTLINVQEAERKRIYQELHDTVIQNIRINLLNLSKFETSNDLLKTVYDTENKNLNSIKNIINNLTPPELTGTDFHCSISNLCQNLETYSKISCHLFIHKEVSFQCFKQEQKLHIYRIIQESLTNIAKHANASEASVIIKKNSDSIVIFITDDGIGMENSSNHGTKLGISGMYSRISFLNGNIQFISNPQSGTEVRIQFPIPVCSTK